MKKILIVSVEPVIPSTHGGVVRTLSIATELSRSCDVTILSPSSRVSSTLYEIQDRLKLVTTPMQRLAPWAGRATLQSRLGFVHFRPMRKELVRLLGDHAPDVVIWSHSYMAFSGIKLVAKVAPSVVQVVDFANIEFIRLRSIARNMSFSLRKLGIILEVLKARIWEARVAAEADLSLTVSESDDEMFVKLYGKEALLVPNGARNSNLLPRTSHELKLLAVANWDYYPNVNGLLQFLDGEWTKITEQWPSAQLIICGKQSERIEHELKSAMNIQFKGYVTDLTREYQECTAALAPAASGGGSQLKVIEAVCQSRPVIGPKYLGESLKSREFENCIFPTDDYVETLKFILENSESLNENCYEVGKRYTWAQVCLPLIAKIC